MKTKSEALRLEGHEWRALRSSEKWDEETKKALEDLRMDLVEPWGLSPKMYSIKTVDEEILPSTKALLQLALPSVPKEITGWNLFRQAFGLNNVVSYAIVVGLLKSKLHLHFSSLNIYTHKSNIYLVTET